MMLQAIKSFLKWSNQTQTQTQLPFKDFEQWNLIVKFEKHESDIHLLTMKILSRPGIYIEVSLGNKMKGNTMESRH